MTEVQALYLILLTVYLSECVEWTARGSVGLRAAGRSALAEAASLPAIGSLRPLLAPLLPWQGEVFLCQMPQIALSARGWAAAMPFALDPDDRHGAPGASGGWGEAGRWGSDGPSVKRNGRTIARAATAAGARRMAALLAWIDSLSPAKREEGIRGAMSRQLDEESARARVAAFLREARLTAFACPALFLYLFGAVPLALWRLGALSTWPWLLAGLLLLMWLCAAAFWRAHARLFPETKGDRLAGVALILLAPTAGIGARQRLARDLLADRHPLAVAAALASGPALARFAGRLYRDLRFPAASPGTLVERDAAIVAEFSRLLRSEAERALGRIGLDPAALLVPSPGGGSDRSRHCPRCLEWYRPDAVRCSDCGLELASPPSSDSEARVGSQASALPS